MSALSSARASLERTIREAQAKIASLEPIPSLDTYQHNDVIRLTVQERYAGGNEHVVVFVKKVVTEGNGKGETWHYTGTLFGQRNGNGHVTWPDLISWCVSHVELLKWEDMVPKVPMKETPDGEAK
jgi:hypothetical protein